MELVELKSIWHLINADISKNDFVEDKILIETIHMKSETEVGKIRRALLFKLVIGGLVTLVGAALLMGIFIAPQKFNTLDFMFSPKETILFYCTLIVSLTAMLLFNYRAYQKVDAAETQALPLKKSLDMVIEAMKKAMNFNIYSDAFMSPVIITWLFYGYAYREDSFSWDWRMLVLAISPFVIGVFAFYVQRYSQKLKFGNYVNKLETYRDELLEENKS
ncbi:MAG: hypothetical protein RLN88_11020 [Ekhidna sp.]|uniref:hypothetical protein n=1 Tax=Ekhidna sp. TaxID=2608089 RepID=UPI0032EBC5C5